MHKGIAIFFTIFISIIACKKTTTNSPIPKIKFKSISPSTILAGKSNKFYLRFEFEDGDGDLGFEPNDTTRNIVITDFRDSIFKVDKYQFPLISTDNNPQNGIIGECIVELNGAFYNFRTDSFHQAEKKDTTIFEFYIEDKAKNKSNVEKSTPIYLIE